MNNVAAFRFKVDVSAVAEQLEKTRSQVEPLVVQAVETLSIATHAYIINQANTKWANSNFKREHYLGIGKEGKGAHGVSSKDPRIDQTVKNLRWIKIADGIWMVELDERARWLEEGRQEMFMGDWLLKPGAKGVKRAKDGSLYRAIPFKETEGRKPAPGANPILANIVLAHLKANNISPTVIEKNSDGTAKIGIIRKLDIRAAEATGFAPGVLYSNPRSSEDSAKTGAGGMRPLPPHAGIFKLQGAVQVQRKVGKKVKKETVVFRTISSKHKAENRWMYPAVEAANFFQSAYEHAERQWRDVIVPGIERQLSTE